MGRTARPRLSRPGGTGDLRSGAGVQCRSAGLRSAKRHRLCTCMCRQVPGSSTSSGLHGVLQLQYAPVCECEPIHWCSRRLNFAPPRPSVAGRKQPTQPILNVLWGARRYGHCLGRHIRMLSATGSAWRARRRAHAAVAEKAAARSCVSMRKGGSRRPSVIASLLGVCKPRARPALHMDYRCSSDSSSGGQLMTALSEPHASGCSGLLHKTKSSQSRAPDQRQPMDRTANTPSGTPAEYALATSINTKHASSRCWRPRCLQRVPCAWAWCVVVSAVATLRGASCTAASRSVVHPGRCFVAKGSGQPCSPVARTQCMRAAVQQLCDNTVAWTACALMRLHVGSAGGATHTAVRGTRKQMQAELAGTKRLTRSANIHVQQ